MVLSLQGISLSAQADDSALYQQAWQLINLDNASAQAPARPYFLFTQDGKMYGYGTCNYFSGKYKSSSNGEFLITQLNRTNETCDGNEQLEVKLMASMLMSNRFKIENTKLQLLNEQSPTVIFESKNDLNKSELIKQASSSKSPKEPQQSRKKGSKNKHGKDGKRGKKINKTANAKAKSKTKTGGKIVKTTGALKVVSPSKDKKKNATTTHKK